MRQNALEWGFIALQLARRSWPGARHTWTVRLMVPVWSESGSWSAPPRRGSGMAGFAAPRAGLRWCCHGVD